MVVHSAARSAECWVDEMVVMWAGQTDASMVEYSVVRMDACKEER